jgi:hypothetical protein
LPWNLNWDGRDLKAGDIVTERNSPRPNLDYAKKSSLHDSKRLIHLDESLKKIDEDYETTHWVNAENLTINIIMFLFIAAYPLRLLWFALRWSIKTLRQQ